MSDKTIKLEIPNDPHIMRAFGRALTEAAGETSEAKSSEHEVRLAIERNYSPAPPESETASPSPGVVVGTDVAHHVIPHEEGGTKFPEVAGLSVKSTPSVGGSLPAPSEAETVPLTAWPEADTVPPAPPEAETAPPAPPGPACWPDTVDTSKGLDANGLPWDSRIHSKGDKPKKTDGTFKLARGIDKDYADGIISELRACVPTAPAPAPPAPPTGEAPPPPPTVRPAPPEETPEETPTDYPSFVATVQDHCLHMHITVQEVNEVCIKHGLADFSNIIDNLDKLPAIYDDLVTIWSARIQS